MDNRNYHLAVGIVLLVASFGFFILPAIAPFDSFIPSMLALVLVIASLGVFITGFASKK